MSGGERQLPTGTVTLLFTDIEGSTQLLRKLGREAYVQALTAHRGLLRQAFTSHGGVEVEMQGDSFHFAFPFARDAVAAAVAGQLALAEHRWDTESIRVRIGLHTGEPMQSDGLYAGLDVHRAARVMSAAYGGQVLLSQRTADLVEGELDRGISVVDLGEHNLKDLPVAHRLYQAVVDGLPADFPPPRGSSGEPKPSAASSPWRRADVVRGALRLRLSWAAAGTAVVLVLAGLVAAALVTSRGEEDDATARTATRATSGSETLETTARFTALPVEPAQVATTPSPAGLSADTVAVIHRGGARILSEIPVGPDPGRIFAGPESIWVAVGNRTIARIDPKTRRMVAAVGTEHDVYDLAPGDEAVWVLAGSPGSAPLLSRVETGRNEATVSARVDVALSRFGGLFSRPAVAVGAGGVWITDPYPPGSVRRVDPVTGEIADPILLAAPAGPAIAIVDGSVWVNTGVDTLVRIDATSRKVGSSIRISVPSAARGGAGATRDPGGPVRLAAGEGALWLITQPASLCCPAQVIGTATLQRIDLDTQAVSGVIPLGGHPTAVAVGLGGVWVATRNGTLYKIDPATLTIRGKLELRHPIGGVSVGADAVWVTLRNSGSG